MVDPADAENGKKTLHQPTHHVLSSSTEAYTHGGVKKTKFEPKLPTRRLKKLSSACLKQSEELVLAEDPSLGTTTLPKELQRLLQQQQQHGELSDGRHGRDRSHERTSKVVFGFSTGGASPSTTTTVNKNRGVGKGVGEISHLSGVRHSERGSRVVEKQEFLHEEGFLGDVSLPKTADSKTFEVFDQEKYFPVTLPLRKPVLGGVDTRRLDEEEFGQEEDEVQDENEDGLEAAEELGLTEPKDGEDTLFFFQFPKGLPFSLNSSGTKEKLKKPSLRSSARLEDLGKGGAMGKLLVYESGAVKFKVGEVVFDALPGTECTFAQEVAAVNTTTKQCSFVGGVHQRVVLTPDVVDVLPDLTDLRTKSYKP